jgi:hypothetical protein
MIVLLQFHVDLNIRRSLKSKVSDRVLSGVEFYRAKTCLIDLSVAERASNLSNITNAYGRFSSQRISDFLTHPRWKANGGDYWMAHTFRLQILNNSLFLSHLPGKEGEEKAKMHPRMYYIICFLHDLLRKVFLPDADFLIYVGDAFDWDMLPFFDSEFRYAIPLFVQEKTTASNTFLIHPRSFYGFADTLREFKNSAPSIPTWAHRLSKAVWRGSTTGGPAREYEINSSRARLVRLSLDNPGLLDARFTTCLVNAATCRIMEKEGMMGQSMSHMEQLKFKMVVMVDGNSLPDRFAHQLALGSVILKQESQHEEFWYKDAIPWVHYIPVANDLSNLVQRIKEGLSNETLLRSISHAGSSLVRRKLGENQVQCLWLQLLQTHSEYFDYPVIPASVRNHSSTFCALP